MRTLLGVAAFIAAAVVIGTLLRDRHHTSRIGRVHVGESALTVERLLGQPDERHEYQGGNVWCGTWDLSGGKLTDVHTVCFRSGRVVSRD